MVLVKLHRAVRKHFGGYRNFLIWILFVSTAVYTIDTFMLPLKHRKSPHHKVNIQSGVSPINNNDAFLIADEPPKRLSNDGDSENEHQMAQQINDDYLEAKKLNEVHVFNNEAKDDDKQNVNFEQGNNDRLINCGVSEPCAHGSYSYLLRTGYQRNGSATICFNGEYLISASLNNNHRGMNIVLINEKTLNIDDIQVFDVYYTDIGLLEYMKENMQEDQIVLIASQDEASYSLKSEGRKAIRELGSSLIDDVAFRDNYVIIGKRGLPSGRALEKMQARESGHDFAEPVQINGCLALPFERNEPLPVDRQRIHSNVKNLKEKNASAAAAAEENKKNGSKAGIAKTRNAEVDRREMVAAKAVEPHAAAIDHNDGEFENCGLEAPCSAEEIAVQLYTGRQNKDPPKICVDGKYVLAADLNGGGRGLNFVVLNPQSKTVLHVAHFDTYSADNIAIEMFLEILNENELVLGVAYDEASDKLERSTRDAIEALGSSFIRALSFRDVWVFVGQKGIKGYSPIEQISFSDASKTSLTWPQPINLKTCVPTQLRPLKQQQISHVNVKRRQFCKKHDGYGQFCNGDVIDDFFKPLLHADASVNTHAIYQVPILVVAGMDHNAVRLQLESLFLNAGLNSKVIRVLYDEKFAESKALAEVFDVPSFSLPGSVKYSDLLQKAIVKGWELFPSSKYLIVLEEEVIPTSDFLNFLRQCYNSLNTDSTLIGISAWNPNGYPETSKDLSAAYRAELLPGLGFILKRTFFEKFMEKKMSECCSSRSWEGWMVGKLGGMEMIIPEVSRVSRGRFDGQASEQVKLMFKQPRLTIGSSELGVIRDPDSLVEIKYVTRMEEIIDKSVPLNDLGIETCLNQSSFFFDIQETNSTAFVIYYNDQDTRVLTRLCNCFKLSGSLVQPGFGQHRHLLRFNQRGRIVFLVASTSPYYRRKPTNVKPLTASRIVS